VQRQQGGHPSKNVWDAAADTTWGDANFTRARAEPATPAGQDVAPSSPTCAVTWATSPTRARPSAWRRVHCLLQEKRAEGDGERGGPRSWREDGRGHCRLNVCPTRTKGGLKNRVVTGGLATNVVVATHTCRVRTTATRKASGAEEDARSCASPSHPSASFHSTGLSYDACASSATGALPDKSPNFHSHQVQQKIKRFDSKQKRSSHDATKHLLEDTLVPLQSLREGSLLRRRYENPMEKLKTLRQDDGGARALDVGKRL
jgi:hypothetical protein